MIETKKKTCRVIFIFFIINLATPREEHISTPDKENSYCTLNSIVQFKNVDGLPVELFPDRSREVFPSCKRLAGALNTGGPTETFHVPPQAPQSACVIGLS